jgi:hypothetical protein
MLDKTQTQKIKPRMQVVCSKEKQFAIVDHVEGARLKLAKDSQGKQHFIPLDWVRTVDDKIHLDRPSEEAMKQWTEN